MLRRLVEWGERVTFANPYTPDYVDRPRARRAARFGDHLRGAGGRRAVAPWPTSRRARRDLGRDRRELSSGVTGTTPAAAGRAARLAALAASTTSPSTKPS